MNATQKLIQHFDGTGLLNPGIASEELDCLLSENNVTLPDDFKAFYLTINGMKEQDGNGFHFYSIEDLIEINKQAKDWVDGHSYLFVDYMLKSWLYAVRIEIAGYTIGIVSQQGKFIPITHSLNEFIELYLKDDNTLYRVDN